MFSDRFKHAFKVALAMVITYAIALGMAWEKPFWAALSVIFCSLATAGESIDRGIQRILGTALAGVAALVLIALFGQERWPFLLSTTAFLAVCTYAWTGGGRNFFVWFNAGFNFPILVILGEGLSVSTFDTVILRAQETALGVVVYSFVAVLVWPRRGGTSFRGAMVDLAGAQAELFDRYLDTMTGKGEPVGDGGAGKLRAEIAAALPGLGGQLEGAGYDSAEIWAQRRAWRRCIQELSALNEALDHWRVGLSGLNGLDVQQLIPGLSAFGAEIRTRMNGVRSMLSGQPPPRRPAAVGLHADQESLLSLSHAQRSALLLSREHLAQIDRLSLALFKTAAAVGGFSAADRRPAAVGSSPFVPDPDRLLATARQSVVLWLLILLAIYLPDFPNVVGTIAMGNAFAMGFAIVPFLQARVLLVPSIVGVAFAGVLYMFVMPHLSGFASLGTMIFAATFVIGYLYHRREDFLARAMGLTWMVIVIGAENHQTYSFYYFANWLMASVFFVLVMMVAWRLPISFRPEVRFPSMLRRFFSSAGWLLSDLASGPEAETSALGRWRRRFHVQEITVLPARLQAWAGTLPDEALGDGGRERLLSLLASVHDISRRMQALLQAEPAARSLAGFADLTRVLREWQETVGGAFSELSGEFRASELTAFRARLGNAMTRLETRVDGALDGMHAAAVLAEQGENAYRVLGACRGMSGALMESMERIPPIDWGRLRESRF